MKLEVLPADKGDCLMIHTDVGGKPGLVLIDGGPAGVFADTLLPRLEELRQERIDEELIGEDEPLVIDLLIVSHVDDDHLNGIIDLLQEMKDEADASKPPRFRILEIWHNSFDRVLGNDETGALLGEAPQFGAASTNALQSLVEEAEQGPPTDHAKILASVKQGDDLKQLAQALGIPVNAQFGGKLIQTSPDRTVTGTAAGIEFVVAGPRQSELIELQKEFDRWLKKQPFADRSPAAMLAALDDESAANLSSIVLLARKDGKTLLLTGDARSDKVLDGLDDAGLCGPNESVEVGVLKMPHHGSIRNLDEQGDFLRRVTSRHYVFSGNGEHSNPDRETFELLFNARPGAEMNLYLTYTLAEIDPTRKAVYDKERAKKLKKGHEVPIWSDAAHSLKAILEPAPDGVHVIAATGSTIIEP